jgi:hypothetical protein
MTGSSTDVVLFVFCVELSLLWSGVSARKTENLMVFSRCSCDGMLFAEMKDIRMKNREMIELPASLGRLTVIWVMRLVFVANRKGQKNDENVNGRR